MAFEIKQVEWTSWPVEGSAKLVVTLKSGTKLVTDAEQRWWRRGYKAAFFMEGLPQDSSVTIKDYEYFQHTDDPELIKIVSEFCEAVSNHHKSPYINQVFDY